jgi:serpin B
MKKMLAIFMALLALLSVVGCSQAVSAAEQKSSKPRESAPVVSPNDAASLSQGNSTFALNMLQTLKDKPGNLFFSPYSISEALAMTYAGARGDTAGQMASAMQFLLSQDKLHPAFNNVDIALAARGQGAQGQDQKGFRLKVVNAIWGQNGYQFSSPYLDLLAGNYGAGMRIVDYKKAHEQARQTINQWVADQTENKIKDLLPPGSVDPLTRLVLTNAIYFNAAWAAQFDKAGTVNAPFSLLDGSQVSVPVMQQYAKPYNYAAGSNYQAIELPYDGRQLSMVVLLPAAGHYAQFESSLDYAGLTSILKQLKSAAVNLSMPKFKFETELDLKNNLLKLGIKDAFDPLKVDLSGMDGKKDLYISGVVHKAYVSVDEAGTEAAAATGVIVGTTSMPMEIKDFKMDRPFIFLIQDKPTGTILFLGRVTNPAK